MTTTETQPQSVEFDYRLILPAGWERLPADRSTIDRLLKQAKEKFQAANRPDLDAQMRILLEGMYRKFATAQIQSIFMTTESENFPIPLSITCRTHSAEGSENLDAQVVDILRNKGGDFLGDDKGILRWEAKQIQEVMDEQVSINVINYLIPVPGTKRTKALHFASTVILPPAGQEDHELTVADIVTLSDAIIATFAWTGVKSV